MLKGLMENIIERKKIIVVFIINVIIEDLGK